RGALRRHALLLRAALPDRHPAGRVRRHGARQAPGGRAGDRAGAGAGGDGPRAKRRGPDLRRRGGLDAHDPLVLPAAGGASRGAAELTLRRLGFFGLPAADRGLGDPAAPQAAGAHPDVTYGAVHQRLDALEVGLHGARGDVVRVADVAAENRLLAAELALP